MNAGLEYLPRIEEDIGVHGAFQYPNHPSKAALVESLHHELLQVGPDTNTSPVVSNATFPGVSPISGSKSIDVQVPDVRACPIWPRLASFGLDPAPVQAVIPQQKVARMH